MINLAIATWALNKLTPSQQIVALQKCHIDIRVWREAKELVLPGLASQLLARENIALVLPQGHPLTQAESLLLAALRHKQFIVLPPPEVSLGLYLHNLCLQQGFKPDIVYQVNEPQMLIALVAEVWHHAAARKVTAVFLGPVCVFARCSRRR